MENVISWMITIAVMAIIGYQQHRIRVLREQNNALERKNESQRNTIQWQGAVNREQRNLISWQARTIKRKVQEAIEQRKIQK